MTFAAGVTLALAGLQAISSFQSGRNQAALENTNAKIAERNAKIAAEQGKFAEEQDAKRVRKFKGAQEAAFGKAGVSAPIDVLEETAAEGELSFQAIKFETLTAVQNFKLQASAARQRAGAARSAGNFGAVTSLLGGFASTSVLDSLSFGGGSNLAFGTVPTATAASSGSRLGITAPNFFNP